MSWRHVEDVLRLSWDIHFTGYVQLNAVDKNTSNNQHSMALTHKQLDSNGLVLSTVATDAVMLKDQAISSHGAD